MNRELLLKVKEHILEEPKRLSMATWIDRKVNEEDDDYYPACGTVACIAGWALILSGNDKVPSMEVLGKAREVLDISPKESNALFFTVDWPFPFWGDYNSARKSGEKTRIAKATAKRIDAFIAEHS